MRDSRRFLIHCKDAAHGAHLLARARTALHAYACEALWMPTVEHIIREATPQDVAILFDSDLTVDLEDSLFNIALSLPESTTLVLLPAAQLPHHAPALLLQGAKDVLAEEHLETALLSWAPQPIDRALNTLCEHACSITGCTGAVLLTSDGAHVHARAGVYVEPELFSSLFPVGLPLPPANEQFSVQTSARLHGTLGAIAQAFSFEALATIPFGSDNVRGYLVVGNIRPLPFPEAVRASLRDLAHLAHEILLLRRQLTAPREASNTDAHLLESISDAFLTLDSEWRFTYMNARAEEILGYTRHAVIGISLWEVHPDAVDTEFYARYHRVMRTRQAEVFEAWYSGLNVWFSVRVFPFRDGICLYFLDVTHEKKRRIHERQMAALVERTDAGVLGGDLSGELTLWNPAMSTLTGMTFHEAKAGALNEALLLNGSPLSVETLSTIASQRLQEGILTTPSGTKQVEYYAVHLLAEELGEESYALIVRDLTQRNERDQVQRLLETALNQGNDAVIITQAPVNPKQGFRIQFANPVLSQQTGYSEEEYLGKSPRMFQGPGTCLETRKRMRARLNKGEAVREVLLNYRKDGTPFWVELSIVPVLNPAGHLTHWVSIQRDVTEQRELEQKLREEGERLRLALDVGGIATWEWMYEKDEFSADAAFLYTMGLNPAIPSFTSEQVLERIHPDDRAFVSDSIALHLSQHTRGLALEFRALYPGGWKWLSVRGTVVAQDGESRFARMLGTVMDITQSKLFEQTLQEARLRAEEATQARTAMIRNLSHELRTPITSMLGFSEIIREEADKELAELADLLHQSTQRLSGTLTAVLDLITLETEQKPVRWLWSNLVDHLQDSARPYESLMEDKGIEFKVVVPDAYVGFYTDPQLFAGIFRPLVDNAFKFTDSGSISIHLDHYDERLLVWSVRDTGPGIAQDFIPRAFEPFTQEHNADDRPYEGLGLGLGLARRSAERLGGELEIHSEKGMGTTVLVRLPRHIHAPGLTEIEHLRHAHGEMPHVVLLEADPALRVFITECLDRQANLEFVQHISDLHHVSVSRSTHALLVRIPHAPEDVEQLQRLAEQTQQKGHVPLVGYAPLSDARSEEDFLKLGLHAVLRIPFSKGLLLQTLDSVMSGPQGS